jgi:hypothetical protein
MDKLFYSIVNERSVTRLNPFVPLMNKLVNIFLTARFVMHSLEYQACLSKGKILTVKMGTWYQM